jgi:hypothetical protein
MGHIQSGHANALVARIAAKAIISNALIPSFIRSLGRPANDLVANSFSCAYIQYPRRSENIPMVVTTAGKYLLRATLGRSLGILIIPARQ